MSLFGKQDDTAGLPERILGQVSVMGEAQAPLSPASAPAPAQLEAVLAPESPFLREADQPAEPSLAAAKGRTSPWKRALRGAGTFGVPRMPLPKALLWSGGGLLLLFCVAAGGYLLYQRSLTPEPAAPEMAPAETTPPVLESAAFSLESPNYLSVDTETVTAETVTRELRKQGEKLLAAGLSMPVAFQITDQNNNPLALSRFIFLVEAPLPDELLTALDEDFRVYLYNDQGQVRAGLLAHFKPDFANPEALLLGVEEALPGAFDALFYPESFVLPAKPTFAAGTYAGVPVRYSNLDPGDNFSLDYILAGKDLIVGSSKESARAIFSAQTGRE